MNTPKINYDDYYLRFGGIARLYGLKKLEIFLNSHILVVGLGGIGSYAIEALARSGIGNITIVDLDDICITNTNRQIHAINSNLGKSKSTATKNRILEINPQCNVIEINDFFTEKNCTKIFSNQYDFVIDAIDSLQSKCVLANYCHKNQIPIIVTGGAAGKKDLSLIKLEDLGLVCNDSLIFNMRKRLRQEFEFQSGEHFTRSKKQFFNIPCVYSDENPVYPTNNGEICQTPTDSKKVALDCREGMGSAMHITATFGFKCVEYVLGKL